ncbi:MAG: DNA polymerase III subunit alpha [Candidatus Aminicenantaceae bacterium]
MASDFVHLHTHSDFSLLDGAVKPAELVKAAVRANMPAVALTDHGNIFGAIPFFQAAHDTAINPVLGCEVYVAPLGRNHKKPFIDGPGHYHLVLLVKDAAGYRNLCQLITKSYLEGFYYRPRVDKELLSEFGEGLIALSACLQGEVSDYLSRDLEDKAEEAALTYMSLFPDGDFYIELQNHGLEPQKKINPHLIQLARKLGIPLVATNDVHYLNKQDADSHDILLCIQTNKRVSDQDRICFGSKEFYFKSREEMLALFPDAPEAVSNTALVAEKCAFELTSSGYHLPRFDAPDGKSLGEYFEEVVRSGYQERMQQLSPRIAAGELPPARDYEARLEKEIQLVREMGFEGYFLIVWDMIRFAHSQNIPVGPGRGSAAGSLLAYSLGITVIDPLEYDLLFERFLNPERISLPDIDIDFCGRRRDEVIEYVTQKYGRDNVSQIITFGTMAARQAIRDVGRALEVPLPEVDKIAKMIPPLGEDSSISAASEKIPQLKSLKEKDPRVANLLNVAKRLEGQVRHASIHAAGIVITPRPLVEFIPLYKSAREEITTQFPMQDVESIGLLKMDLLGLRNLTVIQDTKDQVLEATGERIDLNDMPLDDELTFRVFQEGNTDGVFQFESSGMKDLLRRFKPETFRDLIAMNALYRPGPLQSGMTEDFIRCKHDPERIKYDPPELEPILKETKGLIVYQEQVMRIATDIAGFSMAEADLLRKAMGKKKTAVMKAQKKRFVDGAKKNGISSAKANKIFEQIKYFAGYGFNKSHSAAYAYLAFQTAFLKAHYPVFFLAALLTSEAERGATPQVVRYINECREMGITVLPPDINRSELHFSAEGEGIRFGLVAVKNVGEGAVRALIEARHSLDGGGGAFASPFDVCREVDSKAINRKVIESLIKSGALDGLGFKRSQLFGFLDTMITYAGDYQRAEASNQTLLFGSGQLEPPPIPRRILEMSEWDEQVFLAHEKEALGFYISGHPLAQYGRRLKGLITHTIDRLDDTQAADVEVSLAGIISSIRLLKTRKDERMATFMLEDMSGRVEAVAFPDCYKSSYDSIREDLLVWVKGRLQGNGDRNKLQALQVMPLEKAFQIRAKRMVLRIELAGLEQSVFGELKAILSENPGECPVYFELKTEDSDRLVVQSVDIQGISPSDRLIKPLEDLLGKNMVFIQY